MSYDPETVADLEFTRLRELLTVRDIGSWNCSYERVWQAASEWMLTATGDAISDQGSALGFECSHDPNDRSLLRTTACTGPGVTARSGSISRRLLLVYSSCLMCLSRRSRRS